MTWATDSQHDTLAEAITAATTLHEQFGRFVRVIDMAEGRIHFKLGQLPKKKPTGAHKGILAGQGGRRATR